MLARADQALQILERYKTRLDAVSGSLSALEVEDLVTVRDVVTVLQRAEMVRRIAEEIEGYVDRARRRRPAGPAPARGADGRRRGRPPPRGQGLLPSTADVDADRRDALEVLAELDAESLLDLSGGRRRAAPADATPASTRRSSRAATGCCPRSRGCPSSSPTTSSTASANLQKIMRASVDDLDEVEGVGEARARAIKEGLSRLAETSILERYV